MGRPNATLHPFPLTLTTHGFSSRLHLDTAADPTAAHAGSSHFRQDRPPDRTGAQVVRVLLGPERCIHAFDMQQSLRNHNQRSECGAAGFTCKLLSSRHRIQYDSGKRYGSIYNCSICSEIHYRKRLKVRYYSGPERSCVLVSGTDFLGDFLNQPCADTEGDDDYIFDMVDLYVLCVSSE